MTGLAYEPQETCSSLESSGPEVGVGVEDGDTPRLTWRGMCVHTP